jgi:hypothetical protein
MVVRGRPLTSAEIEPVLAPLEHARPFPGTAYLDDEVFAFEESAVSVAGG